jgi:NRPS condensation-like uncharacterized protein
MEAEITDINSQEIMDEYVKLTDHEWNLYEEGMLKIRAWNMPEETCFLLVFHHLLADGRGALGLAQEFADCYVSGITPTLVTEKWISSISEFPEDSNLPFISRFLINRANKTAEKEFHLSSHKNVSAETTDTSNNITASTNDIHPVSYEEYLKFVSTFMPSDKVSYNCLTVEPEELSSIREECHTHNVTINDYLLARMMRDKKTSKIIMACDLREKLECYSAGALGNYSTAFSVEMKNSDGDLFELAEKIHASVRDTMSSPAKLYLVLQCYANLRPEIIDAAFITCKSDFPGKAGKFVGSMFFGFEKGDGHSITNLGAIESANISNAFFIPPASPAIKNTQGVLTVNGTMRICTAAR